MLKYFYKMQFRLILLICILSFHTVGFADNGVPTFNITVPRTTINVGEPLVGQLEFHFKEPQLSIKKEIVKQINAEHELYLSIEKGEAAIYQDRFAYRTKLNLQVPQTPSGDEAGLDYKGTFMIWYDLLGNKIFFDEPGEYIVRLGFAEQLLSKPVKITVKSENKKAIEALKVFTGLEDYLLLFIGLDEFPEKRAGMLERLKQVNKLSEGTMLEKWSAARLGVVCWKDIQHEKDDSKYDEVHKYLKKGIELPDDFPVREEALYDLGLIEGRKGNQERADSLRNELIKKYPKGEFAKTVIHRDDNEVKLIEITKGSFSSIYPAMWFSPSTGEISALQEVSEEPPELKYEIWIEPSDPEFSFLNRRKGSEVFVYTGTGQDTFMNPVYEDNSEQNYELHSLMNNIDAETLPVFYIKSHISNTRCFIQILTWEKDNEIIRFKWRKATKSEISIFG